MKLEEILVAMARLIQAGSTADVAINTILAVYGANTNNCDTNHQLNGAQLPSRHFACIITGLTSGKCFASESVCEFLRGQL